MPVRGVSHTCNMKHSHRESHACVRNHHLARMRRITHAWNYPCEGRAASYTDHVALHAHSGLSTHEGRCNIHAEIAMRASVQAYRCMHLCARQIVPLHVLLVHTEGMLLPSFLGEHLQLFFKCANSAHDFDLSSTHRS